MTPIRCFRVIEDALEFYTEDFLGNRTLVAVAANKTQLEWLVNCMVAFHKVKALSWNDPDSKI